MHSNVRFAALAPLDGETFFARAFATDAADLDAPIEASNPVASIDALLQACLRDAQGRAPGCEAVRRWTVARRLDALIAIREAGRGAIERIAFRCEVPSCRQAYEAEIDLSACRADAGASETEADVGGKSLPVRLPTGADHARWQDERTPLRLVAANLLGADGPVGDDVVAAVDAALAEADPMRELTLELACPACGAVGRHCVDLEAHLLAGFARQQVRWLSEIAWLARAFHWPEAEIARLPAWRRDFYLARVEVAGIAGLAA
jgi:hypothetical protein